MKLTAAQRNVLEALLQLAGKGRRPRRIDANTVDATYDGRTVASLLDRGLVRLEWTGTGENVYYAVTDAGRAALAATVQP